MFDLCWKEMQVISGDYASISHEKLEEDKNEEGFSLLIQREPKGTKTFKYWTCNEYGHYSYKCPKRERKYKKNLYKPWKHLFTTDE